MSHEVQNLFLEEIERFKAFMENTPKGDEWHFKLYSVPYPNTKLDRKYFRYQNFDSKDSHDSINCFKAALELHGDRADQFFIIRNMKGSTDPKPVDFAIKNPFYNPSIFKQNFSSASINGIAQQQNSNNMIGMMQMMMMQQQQHFELMQAKDKELRDEKEDRKIERLEGIIDEIKNQQATTIDKISGFLEGTTGQQIVNGILGMLQNNQMAHLGAIQNSHQDKMHLTREKSPSFERSENETKVTEETTLGTQAKSQEEQVQNYVSEAIEKLGSVFGNETLIVLYELSEYCQQNPVVAKQIREQIRPKQQTNE